MAALRFVNVTEEVMNAFKENSIPKSTKDATKFGVTLSKERYELLLMELNKRDTISITTSVTR